MRKTIIIKEVNVYFSLNVSYNILKKKRKRNEVFILFMIIILLKYKKKKELKHIFQNQSKIML